MIPDVEFICDGYTKSAYENYSLVLTNVEDIPPMPKLLTVEIPGSDGVLDLSESESGYVRFYNRTLTLTFEVIDVNNYHEIKRKVALLVHGKTMKIRLSSDPNYIYEGMVTVLEWACSQRIGRIVLTVDAKPFRSSYVQKSWTYEKATDGEVTESIIAESMRPMVASIGATGNLVVNGVSLISQGVDSLIEYENILLMGETQLTISGTGKMVMRWNEVVI